MLTEGFFKLGLEDNNIVVLFFLSKPQDIIDPDMFDRTAFTGKPPAGLNVFGQYELFKIFFERACIKDSIPRSRRYEFFPYFHLVISCRKVIRIWRNKNI